MKEVRLVLHEPARAEKVLVLDKPWEGKHAAYFTVFKDGERYRLYYRGQAGDQGEVTCYAQSKDGVRWEKPELGIVEHKGSTRNNIVLTGAGKTGTHNFTPCFDTRPGVAVDYFTLLGVPGLLS